MIMAEDKTTGNPTATISWVSIPYKPLPKSTVVTKGFKQATVWQLSLWQIRVSFMPVGATVVGF